MVFTRQLGIIQRLNGEGESALAVASLDVLLMDYSGGFEVKNSDLVQL